MMNTSQLMKALSGKIDPKQIASKAGATAGEGETSVQFQEILSQLMPVSQAPTGNLVADFEIPPSLLFAGLFTEGGKALPADAQQPASESQTTSDAPVHVLTDITAYLPFLLGVQASASPVASGVNAAAAADGSAAGEQASTTPAGSASPLTLAVAQAQTPVVLQEQAPMLAIPATMLVSDSDKPANTAAASGEDIPVITDLKLTPATLPLPEKKNVAAGPVSNNTVDPKSTATKQRAGEKGSTDQAVPAPTMELADKINEVLKRGQPAKDVKAEADAPARASSAASPVQRTQSTDGTMATTPIPVTPARDAEAKRSEAVPSSDQTAPASHAADSRVTAPAQSGDAGDASSGRQSAANTSQQQPQIAHPVAATIRHAEPLTAEVQRPALPLSPETTQNVTDQVIKNLVLQVKGENSEMRLTLKPESLGEVVLRVRMEEGQLQAQFDVSQPAVKATIESTLPQLRQALAERGLDIQRIDVFAAGQSLARDGSTNREEQARRRGSDRRTDDSDGTEDLQAQKQMGYNTMEVII